MAVNYSPFCFNINKIHKMSISILIIPTYDITTLGVFVSLGGGHTPAPPDPTLTIEVPGFSTVTGLAFTFDEIVLYNSIDLGISTEVENLPDGIYCITFVSDPSPTPPIEKKIMRVDRLMQKFDEAFMKLDIIECDRALKKQAQIDLMTIYFFIQGAIASANNCAVVESTKLYIKANSMLDTFLQEDCGCSGNNYVINFS